MTIIIFMIITFYLGGPPAMIGTIGQVGVKRHVGFLLLDKLSRK